MNKRLLIGALVIGIWGAGAGRVAAQTSSASQAPSAGVSRTDWPPEENIVQISDLDIELLRKDLRSEKKQIVAANLKLSDDQATKFWPVYGQYIAEQVKIHDQKYALIKELAASWGSISDAKAEDMTRRALAMDQQITQLRIKYVPNFLKVLPGKQVATFFQIDRRLQMMVDLQLMSQLPLIQSQ